MGAEIVVMCVAMGSAEEVQQHSAKLVSFIDLAGHEKYLKTTLSGMVRTHATHSSREADLLCRSV
jgi:GTPase